LKAEQARIATDVRAAEERLAAVDAHLAEWQEIFETAMRFATNCAKDYARASAPTRRRFNQAVLTRIDVRNGKIADVGYNRPFDLLSSSSEFEYGDLVGRTGLEPVTPCASCKCAAICANGPWLKLALARARRRRPAARTRADLLSRMLPVHTRLPPSRSASATLEAPTASDSEQLRPSSRPGGSHRRGRHRTRRLPSERATGLARLATLAVVLGSTAFAVVAVHPGLLFSQSIDVGGDTAGHVAAVHYFVYDLLAHGRITGWDPQWFDGFPLYVFYFPGPSILIAGLSLVFTYTVAFKLVTVLGIVALPAAAWAFGALAGFRRPIPAIMAAAMIPYLFNTSYTIDGGNIASTMAGEYSFTIALALALVFLGVFTKSLHTGRYRAVAAMLFAATAFCHVVPALFAAAAAIVLTLFEHPVRGLRVLVPVGVVGGLLIAFWLLPFGLDLRYSSAMGYSALTGIVANLFPTAWLYVIVCAGIGAVAALVNRDRVGLALATMVVGSGAAFVLIPSGEIYNGRWLPFWFLATALLGAYGVAEALRGVTYLARLEAWQAAPAALLGGLGSLGVVAASLGVLPFYTTPPASKSFVEGWVTWNYTGYQGKVGWPVYENIVTMLDRATSRFGCGRLQYEYTRRTEDQFGSTLAFLSLPMFTNGCIDTTSGLYYESSTTSPFHFLDQTEFSLHPSQPMIGLPYGSYDVADGVRHLQLMGVRYLLTATATTGAAAKADPSLVEIGSTPGVPTTVATGTGTTVIVHHRWRLFLVKDAPLVVPLTHEPVVEAGMTKAAWLAEAITWYQDEQYWPVEIAQSGPPSWPRAAPGTLVPESQAISVPRTTVSAVATTNESIAFTVSRVGIPVLVKIPYFPNWHASGAEGPYPVTPNLMVVVPESHRVVLSYGTSRADWLGRAGSIVGLLGLGVLFVARGPDLSSRSEYPGGQTTDTENPAGDDLALDDPVLPRDDNPTSSGESDPLTTSGLHYGPDPAEIQDLPE